MVEGFDIAAVHGSLLRADISHDRLRSDITRIDDAVHVQAAEDPFVVGAVDLGNDFGMGDVSGMECQQDILLVDAGQGNEGLHVFDPFLPKQLFVGAVAVDDYGPGQQDTQFFTAFGIAVDDLDRDAHMEQLGGKIIGRFTAADDHGIFDRMGLKTDFFEEGFGIPSGGDEGDAVAPQDTEITGRNVDLAVSFHGADQHVVGDIPAHGLAQIGHHHAVQQIFFRYFKLDHFRLAVGEGVHFQCGGEVEDARHLAGRFQLRVDDHGKAQPFS